MAARFNTALFDRNYNEVCKFIGQDGKLRLSQKNSQTKYLWNWLTRQFKRKHLTDEQHEKLEHLKAHFDSRSKQEKQEDNWNGHFKALIKYKEEYHTFMIQNKDIEHKRLFKWCHHQKTLEKTGGLTMERKKRLVAIGFEFSPAPPPKEKRFTKKQELAWDIMYTKLKCFKENHGHCQVRHCQERTNNIDNEQLATWVTNQRATYNRGSLDVVRERKLNEIGFIWNGRSKEVDCEKLNESSPPGKEEETSPLLC